MVGVTTYCEFPEAAKAKPKIGGFTDHNLEAIVALKPDLVIVTHNRGAKFTYEKLKGLQIPTQVVSFYGLDELVRSIGEIGESAGRKQESAKIQADFSHLIQEVRDRAEKRKPKKIIFISWTSPLMAAGPRTLETDVIELVGGENIVSDANVRYPRINMETLFERQPDMIIDASSYDAHADFAKRKAAVVSFWRQYPTLAAVKSGNVYVLKENVYTVPGPRTIKLIQAMDRVMSGDKESANEFYERIQF